jgi:hypothetical protein
LKRKLILLSALALAACNHATTGVKTDPALETLVPADTVLMVGTRLEALVKTPVYQKYFAGKRFPQVDDFAQRTGLDPTKDLWQLLFVSNGKRAALLGRGKFANEMEPKLEKEGAQRFGYKGLNLIGNERGAVMFINTTTAAIGDIEGLHWLVDQRETAHGAPPALAAMMKEMPSDTQFWAAYTGGAIRLPFEEGSNLANVNKLISYVESGSVYFDLRTGLNGVAQGNCSSEEGAQQVRDALKALVGMGRLSAPKNQPELLQVYDGIRVTQDSRRVKLYIDVPQELVDKFLQVWIGRGQ